LFDSTLLLPCCVLFVLTGPRLCAQVTSRGQQLTVSGKSRRGASYSSCFMLPPRADIRKMCILFEEDTRTLKIFVPVKSQQSTTQLATSSAASASATRTASAPLPRRRSLSRSPSSRSPSPSPLPEEDDSAHHQHVVQHESRHESQSETDDDDHHDDHHEHDHHWHSFLDFLHLPFLHKSKKHHQHERPASCSSSLATTPVLSPSSSTLSLPAATALKTDEAATMTVASKSATLPASRTLCGQPLPSCLRHDHKKKNCHVHFEEDTTIC
jgi:hypothetical protein